MQIVKQWETAYNPQTCNEVSDDSNTHRRAYRASKRVSKIVTADSCINK